MALSIQSFGFFQQPCNPDVQPSSQAVPGEVFTNLSAIYSHIYVYIYIYLYFLYIMRIYIYMHLYICIYIYISYIIREYKLLGFWPILTHCRGLSNCHQCGPIFLIRLRYHLPQMYLNMILATCWASTLSSFKHGHGSMRLHICEWL